MKRILPILLLLLVAFAATAQKKPRPDAFPPVEEPAPKALTMATTVEEMASWDRYPTYSVYVDMMQGWANEFPSLCRLDTIGTSVNGRLILCLEITAHPGNPTLPEFFYSSTMHGDELTGYAMMLHLIDTLLHGYGSNPQYTMLIENIRICINPLANPDGTYYGGNNSVQHSRRYNAHNVDLNRNYPDPFGSSPSSIEPENEAMIAYFNSHNFSLSANLHGGAEVVNYPWDSYTSAQNPHPDREWWLGVCQRFIDTLNLYTTGHFDDVEDCGYICGGDWYVISGGRQDYFNYYNNCLELTLEISSTKKLNSNYLPTYWNFLQHPLVNYIEEILSLFPHDSITVEDAAISPDSILFWAGSGDKSAMVAVSWADSALAWGVRFGQETITARQAMDTIAAHDWRFRFDTIGPDFAFADSTDTLHITPGYQWHCLLNGHAADGMATMLVNGDLLKWGDMATAVVADSTWNDDSNGWDYAYVWLDSIFPVCIPPDTTSPQPDPPAPPDPPVGIVSANGVAITVYPNPATDYIIVSGARGPIELYDATGRKVYCQSSITPNNTTTIDLGGLPVGVYLLRCCGAMAKVVKTNSR